MKNGDREIVSGICSRLASRIGAERYELWFGATTALSHDGHRLRITTDSAFPPTSSQTTADGDPWGRPGRSSGAEAEIEFDVDLTLNGKSADVGRGTPTPTPSQVSPPADRPVSRPDPESSRSIVPAATSRWGGTLAKGAGLPVSTPLSSAPAISLPWGPRP